MVFARDYNQLITKNFIRLTELSKQTKDLTNKRFGNLVPIIPLMYIANDHYNTVYWICRCDCGNYYRIIANKIIYNKITCCPECNDGVITRGQKIVHPVNFTARKSDEELVNILADDYYMFFKERIELEDFKQELHYIFALNRSKNKSRTWSSQYYLRDLMCRLRGYYKKPIKFTTEYLDENIIDINRLDYLDIYPLDKKLHQYMDKYLTENERTVLMYIYKYNLSIIKIAEIMKLSKQRISQIHLKALDKLKTKFNGGDLRMDNKNYLMKKIRRDERKYKT